ncbi:hypothetical protein [Actinoplanes sp. RD1]|uniref:hypothetical protein n=1 Tax=Actinoplanes sp. RD1 TaxID=3064538 RepID=UPI002741C999|nr:hypothetical protein [Actinoplanes sp. RD1]
MDNTWINAVLSELREADSRGPDAGKAVASAQVLALVAVANALERIADAWAEQNKQRRDS